MINKTKKMSKKLLVVCKSHRKKSNKTKKQKKKRTKQNLIPDDNVSFSVGKLNKERNVRVDNNRIL